MKIYKIGGVYITYGGDEKYKVIVGKPTKAAPIE
jgi:hypothetical protein